MFGIPFIDREDIRWKLLTKGFVETVRQQITRGGIFPVYLSDDYLNFMEIE